MPFAKQVREKANARIAAAGVRVLFRSLSAFLLPLFLCPAQHKLCDLFTCQIRIRKIRDRGFCVHDQNTVCFKVKRHDSGQEQNQRRYGGKHTLFAPGGLRLPCRYYFRGLAFQKVLHSLVGLAADLLCRLCKGAARAVAAVILYGCPRIILKGFSGAPAGQISRTSLKKALLLTIECSGCCHQSAPSFSSRPFKISVKAKNSSCRAR